MTSASSLTPSCADPLLLRAQIFVVMAMLVRIMHWAPAMAGLVVTVVMIPLSTLLGKKLGAARRAQIKQTDARVKLATEIITGIKAIKLYAWVRVLLVALVFGTCVAAAACWQGMSGGTVLLHLVSVLGPVYLAQPVSSSSPQQPCIMNRLDTAPHDHHHHTTTSHHPPQEDAYMERIGKLRDAELKQIRFTQLLSAMNSALYMSGPVLVALAAFGVHTALGYKLTAAVAFPALSLFNLLRFPIIMFPSQVRACTCVCGYRVLYGTQGVQETARMAALASSLPSCARS